MGRLATFCLLHRNSRREDGETYGEAPALSTGLLQCNIDRYRGPTLRGQRPRATAPSSGKSLRLGGTVLVKKYSNRRLYDTQESRYITMSELADRIRQGADARVVDANSGEDLTQSTLTQIIIEGRGGAKMLPVPFLLQLIRLGDGALSEFLGRYMSWALETYLQLKQGAQNVSAFNPLATLPFNATNALARLIVSGLGSASPPPAPVQPPRPAENGAPHPPPDDAIAELRREIDALKKSAKRRARRGG
jgi:polyhydroxyalkanoate synthesis repressor PhaR